MKILERLINPLRGFVRRFINDETQKLFYKAGNFSAYSKIEGDYFEFGVFFGGSFASAFQLIGRAYRDRYTPSDWNNEQDCIERRKLWEKMRFIAFDSFQGLPKPNGIDLLSRDFFEERYSNSEDSFTDYITSMGVPLNRVEIVSGWFNKTLNEETLRKYRLKHAAIVHIDSDLYESARLALTFLKPLLVDGTIIIFDNWYNFKGNPNLGEQRAFKEWFDENPNWIATQYQKEGVWRNSFILNKKLRD